MSRINDRREILVFAVWRLSSFGGFRRGFEIRAYLRDLVENPVAGTLYRTIGTITNNICTNFRQNGWYKVSILSKKLKIDCTTCTDFNDSRHGGRPR